MRIALVSDSIYPYNKGGKETRSYDLAKNLSKDNNNEVHFYTMKFWEGKDIIKKDGFYLHGICKPLPLYVNGKRSIKQGIKFGLASFKLFKEDFDVMDADHMVYFHLWPCKLACLVKKKKFIVTWHEVWGKEYWKKYMGWKGIFGYWIEKLSSKLPNKIITISNHTKERLINDLKVKKEKITMIPCWIDIKNIDSIKPSKEHSDIIFAGRLMHHKNVNKLIKAMSYIKDKKLIIVGDGEEMENLNQLAKSLNISKNVIFKGFLKESKEVISLIKSSKVFVLPSTREGFGITVIEANACEIPVITVNHKDNASKDLIQEGKNGYVCKLDERDIADNIIKALKRKDWETKEYVKKYNWSNMIMQFKEAYE